MFPSRAAELAATVADPAPVLQLIVVSAVEILQGSAGVIALVEHDEGGQRLVPRASYGLPAGAVASLHPRLDRAILNVLGQLGEQVSVLYVPSGFGDWARRYHVLALPMQLEDHLLGVIYVFRPTDAGGFSDRDLHVLDVFARQVQHAHLLAELAEHVEDGAVQPRVKARQGTCWQAVTRARDQAIVLEQRNYARGALQDFDG